MKFQPDCFYETKYKQSLASHRQDKHSSHGRKRVTSSKEEEERQRLVQCPVCKKMIKKWYYQQSHRRSCIGEGRAAFMSFAWPGTCTNHGKIVKLV